MRKPIIKLGDILIAFLVIISGIVVFLWHSSNQNENKEYLKKDILSLEEDMQYYTKIQEEYTPTKINENIAEDSINIKEKFEQKREDIRKGITQVYENTKTEEEYNKLAEIITPILGEQFSEKLLELNKPIINDSGGVSFPYDKLNDVKFALGEYDIDSHTADLLVLIEYQSSEIGVNNDGVERESKTAVIMGKDLFILDYNLADDSLRLKDHQQELRSEVK